LEPLHKGADKSKHSLLAVANFQIEVYTFVCWKTWLEYNKPETFEQNKNLIQTSAPWNNQQDCLLQLKRD